MSDNDLFTAWINLSKYYERIFKSLDHILQEQFQLGTKEFYLMYYLEQTEKKKMKLAELVPKVNLSHSALSRLITRLEQYQGRKLIERQADDTDKRSVYIFLTKSGEELVKKMQTVISSSLQKKMSQKDIQNIKSLVE